MSELKDIKQQICRLFPQKEEIGHLHHYELIAFIFDTVSWVIASREYVNLRIINDRISNTEKRILHIESRVMNDKG